MNRILLWTAAGWIVAANALVLFHVRQNRAAPAQALVELTERELRLEERGEDESAIFLRLAFDGSAMRGAVDRQKDPGWFDVAKLRELGYEIESAALKKPEEARLYSVPSKEVFVVLDSAPPPPSDSASPDKPGPAHLSAIDAGLEPALLRSRHPDTRRYIIVRAVVRPWFERRYDESRRIWETGTLRGVVLQLAVPRIHVPAPHNRFFGRFGNLPSTVHLYPSGEPERSPRYKVTLAYGRHHEPWVVAIDLLPGQ